MTLDSVQTRFAAFYESAVQKGYCRRLPLHLIGEQLKNMLPTIINGDYLRKHNTALSDAIAEYYRILLYQILNEEYLAIANQKSTYTFVDGVVETLTNIFLIR